MRKLLRWTVGCLWFALWAGPAAYAAAGGEPLPTPQFRSYGSAEGLPSGAVYAIAQDRDGMLWFGSAGGLVRFDGVNFKVYRHVVGDPDSLPANQTYALLVDRDNRVWAGGVSSGLIMHDPRQGTFRQWQHTDDVASLADNEVWSMAQGADGAIWIATQGGLDRLVSLDGPVEHVARIDGAGRQVPFGPVRALLAEDDGRLWIAAREGLFLRHADGQVMRVPVDPAFRGDLSRAWRIEGGGDEVRVALDGGLLLIGADGVARPLVEPRIEGLRIVSSLRDTQGRLWLGSLAGVWLGDGRDRFQHITGQPLLPGGLPGDRLWQMLRDREGGLWFAFDQSRIAYLPPDWNGFTRFTHLPDQADSLTGIAAQSVRRSRDGQLWVGGNNGWVDKLDPATGSVRHIVTGLRGNLASLAEDARGRLWIVGPGEIHRWDHGNLTRLDPARIGINRPTAVEAGEDGTIYLSSWGQGVFALDPERLATTPLLPQDAPQDALFHDQLSWHAGRLWYASVGGLLRGEGPGQRLAFVPGVPREEILAFAFDADGFWTATTEQLRHYRLAGSEAREDAAVEISRLPFAPDLMAMRVDRTGRVWLFANPGLWRFDPATRRFDQLGPAQGLSGAEFGNGSVARADDGTLYAASGSGVIAFRPERLQQAAAVGRAPVLTLTGVSARRDGELRDFALDAPLRLHWGDRDLRVQVRLSSFIDPARNAYRFLLDGLDGDWVDTGSRGERDFAGLPAGHYTLRVQAAGANGARAALAMPLVIDVDAPPWLRWWAWLGYALMLILVLALAFRAWRRRVAQRHRLELAEQRRRLAEAASAAKSQFLATLSHEIRTPMTGVMGMAELLLNTPLAPLQREYASTMQRSGAMLLRLMNDTLDLARIEAGRLRLEPAAFDPAQMLRDAAQLVQGLAQGRGLHFACELDPALPPLLVGDALRIRQVLLNLGNNAVKFTEHGSITLAATWADAALVLSVTDTGPGIPAANQARMFQRFEQAEGPQRSAGTGLGLAICRELVEMMGGRIELESALGLGSTFRVVLPLPAPPAAARALPSAAAGEARWRVLLVEDDAVAAEVLRSLLAGAGCVVTAVPNGLAALAEVAAARFDAILLDLDLPGLDGFGVARLLRQREDPTAHVAIIAITARQGESDERLVREAGMDGFLHKPVSGEELAIALRAALGRADAALAD